MMTGSKSSNLARSAVGLAVSSGLVVACGGGGGHAKVTAPPTTSSTTVPVTAAPTTPAPPPTCPLTGTAPPAGGVPARPALAVKVENFPGARPQYGIGSADVVYEEPVEGGITRFIAIFQCHDAARVEPIRSGRIIDPGIVEQYGAHPLMSYSGAIDQAVKAIKTSPLLDIAAETAPPSVYPRDPGRVIPHNLMASTAALYAYGNQLYGKQSTPPPAEFTYGAVGAGAAPAASVHVAYQYSDLTWTYNSGTGAWQRSYSDTGPANLGEGGLITASNVVVMHMNEFPSPFTEDATGSKENLLTLTGSGPAEVYRNGMEIKGTWNRSGLSAMTTYLDASGQVIPLQAGETWIELVPQNVATTTTP